MKLASLLAYPDNNIMVVGDDDQGSTLRGADPEHNSFAEKFDGYHGDS